MLVLTTKLLTWPTDEYFKFHHQQMPYTMSDITAVLRAARRKQQQLIEQLIAEALSQPYVHEECGDTLWDEALAANEARLKEDVLRRHKSKK